MGVSAELALQLHEILLVGVDCLVAFVFFVGVSTHRSHSSLKLVVVIIKTIFNV